MRPPGAPLCIILVFSFIFAVSCDGDATQSDTSQQSDDSATTSQMTEETAMDTTMMESSGIEAATIEETTVEEALPEVVVVKMSGLKFEPARVEISAGTTVRWENVEQVDHNVTSEDDGPLKSDTFRAGGSYEYTFEEPGEFDYLCTIHPFMKGLVVVR